MLIEAFEQVKGDRFDPLHSATNGLTVQDEELLIAAARAGGDTPSNTAHVAAAGNGTPVGQAQDKKEQERSRAGYDAAVRQQQLQDLYDRLNAEIAALQGKIDALTSEIGDLDGEIAFLRRFNDEDDLVDANGELKGEVREYLTQKGKKPDEMSLAEIMTFMDQTEIGNIERREEAESEREAYEIEKSEREARRAEVEVTAEREGFTLETATAEDIPVLEEAAAEAGVEAFYDQARDSDNSVVQEVAEQQLDASEAAPNSVMSSFSV